MTAKTGRLVVTQVTARGYHVEQVITPEMLHAAGERNTARAVRVGNAAVASIGREKLDYFDRAFALSHRLFDRAHSLFAAARIVLARGIAQDFTVECAGCDERFDIEGTELVGAERYCRPCAAEAHADAAEAMRSDEDDYHYDRGHGHGC